MTPPPIKSTGFVGTTPRLPTSGVGSNPRCTKIPAGVPLAATSPATSLRVPTSVAPTLSTVLQGQLEGQGFMAPAPAAGVSGTAIVLFRSDLRLDDHPALSCALERAATVVPVFCFDPRHFGRTPHGFDKTGKYRARFLIESVQALRDGFRARGSDLIVRLGRPEDVVVDIAARSGASHVMLHREVTFEDQEMERGLEKALKNNGVEMHTLWSNTLYDREDMPFSLEAMPDVYSDFREAVEQRSSIRDPLSAPTELTPLPSHLNVGDVPTLKDLGIADIGVAQHHGVCAVRGGESEAFSRVIAYVEDARRMEAKNPSDSRITSHIGADFSCRISPWLALGCVSPRRIFKEMKEAASSPHLLIRSSTYFELVWRDFFRCITAKYSEKRAVSASRTATPAAALAGV